MCVMALTHIIVNKTHDNVIIIENSTCKIMKIIISKLLQGPSREIYFTPYKFKVVSKHL